jgi:hypothetical protein
MNLQHDLRGLRGALEKDHFKDMHHELHRSEVIIE